MQEWVSIEGILIDLSKSPRHGVAYFLWNIFLSVIMLRMHDPIHWSVEQQSMWTPFGTWFGSTCGKY